MSVIATQGLTKKFGDLVAVDGLDLEIPKGGVVGFVGPERLWEVHHYTDAARVHHPDGGRGASAW